MFPLRIYFGVVPIGRKRDARDSPTPNVLPENPRNFHPSLCPDVLGYEASSKYFSNDL